VHAWPTSQVVFLAAFHDRHSLFKSA
jgi:hypothetical protein